MQELIINQTSINETINTLCNLTFIIAVLLHCYASSGQKFFENYSVQALSC